MSNVPLYDDLNLSDNSFKKRNRNNDGNNANNS